MIYVVLQAHLIQVGKVLYENPSFLPFESPLVAPVLHVRDGLGVVVMHPVLKGTIYAKIVHIYKNWMLNAKRYIYMQYTMC